MAELFASQFPPANLHCAQTSDGEKPSRAGRGLRQRLDAQIVEATNATGTALVIGGRALNADLRRELRYSAFCDTLAHLEAFVQSIQNAHARTN